MRMAKKRAKQRVAVLISGRGSNMTALIEAARDDSFPAEIALVLSNRPDAAGLTRARAEGIATAVVDHTAFGKDRQTLDRQTFDRQTLDRQALDRQALDRQALDRQALDRQAFERAIDAQLQAHRIDLVCLAGFMRLLTPWLVRRWEGRLINIHPALLPAYKGLNTHERVLAAGEKSHGATVHFVVPEMDSGPIIAQGRVPVHDDDTPETLAARVLAEEHRLYPLALKLVASGAVRMVDGQCRIDNRRAARGDLIAPEN
jgi:phosphoribosylglycinamide formyltransferase 1